MSERSMLETATQIERERGEQAVVEWYSALSAPQQKQFLHELDLAADGLAKVFSQLAEAFKDIGAQFAPIIRSFFSQAERFLSELTFDIAVRELAEAKFRERMTRAAATGEVEPDYIDCVVDAF